MNVAEHPVSPDAPLLVGEWRVDPRADEISLDGRVVKLEPLRMRLLMALAQRPGEVVLSNELLDTVWKGAIVTPSSLYQSVAQLRQVLGDDANEPRYIATVPRKGYRLVAPVRPVAEESQAAPRTSTAIEEDSPSPAAAVRTVPVPIGNLSRRRVVIGAGVAAAAVVAAGGVWWSNRPPSEALRIAVLPFSDRSQKGLDQPLANGLTEDVIRALGRHRSLEVIAYDAVARLASASDVLGEAARRLQVAFALLGDITRIGDRVRINTRLVAVPDGDVRSEESFNEQMGTISSAPQAIAAKVADALRVRPSAAEASWKPSSAYEMYVLGIDALRAQTSEGVERARRYFSQGIEIDPNYARNYSALGSTWVVQAEAVGGNIDRNQGFARAEPLYKRALTLDPELVEARLGLANVARHYRRFDEARRTLEAVVQAHPNNAQAHFSLGLTETSDGWPTRAIAHYERAAALNPTHWLIPMRAGVALMYAGKLPEAEARFRRSSELDPSKPFGHFHLGVLQWSRGRLDESLNSHREAVKRSSQVSNIWMSYGRVCTDLSLFDEARMAYSQAERLQRAPSRAALETAYVWLAQGAQPPAPQALRDSVPQLEWDRLFFLAMAGEQPTAALLGATETEQLSYETPDDELFIVVAGRLLAVDIATLFALAGRNDRSAVLLDQAEQTLNTYEQRGVTAPAFDFQRARIWSLRGDTVRALSALQKAVDRGWRRSWWVQRDPALASLRSHSAFTAALQKMDTQNAAQRRNVVAAS